MNRTQSVPLKRREKARKTNRARHGEDEHCRETWDRPVPSSGHRTTCDDCRESETGQPADTVRCMRWEAGEKDTQVDRCIGRDGQGQTDKLAGTQPRPAESQTGRHPGCFLSTC